LKNEQKEELKEVVKGLVTLHDMKGFATSDNLEELKIELKKDLEQKKDVGSGL